MDLLTFLSNIIEYCVWPFFAVLFLFIFKNPITEVIGKIIRFRYKWGEKEILFEREVSATFSKVKKEIKADPVSLIEEAYYALETEYIKALKEKGIYYTNPFELENATKLGLPENKFKLLVKMKELKSLATTGPISVSSGTSADYTASALALELDLSSLITPPSTTESPEEED